MDPTSLQLVLLALRDWGPSSLAANSVRAALGPYMYRRVDSTDLTWTSFPMPDRTQPSRSPEMYYRATTKHLLAVPAAVASTSTTTSNETLGLLQKTYANILAYVCGTDWTGKDLAVSASICTRAVLALMDAYPTLLANPRQTATPVLTWTGLSPFLHPATTAQVDGGPVDTSHLPMVAIGQTGTSRVKGVLLVVRVLPASGARISCRKVAVTHGTAPSARGVRAVGATAFISSLDFPVRVYQAQTALAKLLATVLACVYRRKPQYATDILAVWTGAGAVRLEHTGDALVEAGVVSPAVGARQPPGEEAHQVECLGLGAHQAGISDAVQAATAPYKTLYSVSDQDYSTPEALATLLDLLLPANPHPLYLPVLLFLDSVTPRTGAPGNFANTLLLFCSATAYVHPTHSALMQAVAEYVVGLLDKVFALGGVGARQELQRISRGTQDPHTLRRIIDAAEGPAGPDHALLQPFLVYLLYDAYLAGLAAHSAVAAIGAHAGARLDALVGGTLLTARHVAVDPGLPWTGAGLDAFRVGGTVVHEAFVALRAPGVLAVIGDLQDPSPVATPWTFPVVWASHVGLLVLCAPGGAAPSLLRVGVVGTTLHVTVQGAGNTAATTTHAPVNTDVLVLRWVFVGGAPATPDAVHAVGIGRTCLVWAHVCKGRILYARAIPYASRQTPVVACGGFGEQVVVVHTGRGTHCVTEIEKRTLLRLLLAHTDPRWVWGQGPTVVLSPLLCVLTGVVTPCHPLSRTHIVHLEYAPGTRARASSRLLVLRTDDTGASTLDASRNEETYAIGVPRLSRVHDGRLWVMDSAGTIYCVGSGQTPVPLEVAGFSLVHIQETLRGCVGVVWRDEASSRLYMGEGYM